MKREITVKAFNRRTKQWLYFSIGQQWSDVQSELYSELCLNGVIFYQNTGLKDKHRKDVFEGDILKHPDGETGEVIKHSGYFSYNGGIMGCDELGEQMEYEIIGNIYEPKYKHLLK